MTTDDPARPYSGGTASGGPSTGDAAREHADQAKEQVRSTVHEQVDERSDQAAGLAGSVADDAQQVGDTLREQGNDSAARLVETGARYTQQLADYLSRSDADTILSDVEDVARRQPWAVVLGGVVVGFAGSRLLQASRRKPRPDHDDDAASRAHRAEPVATYPPPAYAEEEAVDVTAYDDARTGLVEDDPYVDPYVDPTPTWSEPGRGSGASSAVTRGD